MANLKLNDPVIRGKARQQPKYSPCVLVLLTYELCTVPVFATGCKADERALMCVGGGLWARCVFNISSVTH